MTGEFIRDFDGSHGRAVASKLMVGRSIGDYEPSRLERVTRAVAEKCRKLAAACTKGRTSILAVESNDIALVSNSGVSAAVHEALSGRDDCPDIVMHVETYQGWFTGWVIENRTQIRLRSSYTRNDLES